jgi:hypothetical protein
VKPFVGDGERVTVAFNCWFDLKGDERPHTSDPDAAYRGATGPVSTLSPAST